MDPIVLNKYLENSATDVEMKQVLDWLNADAANRQELDRLDKAFCASVIHGGGTAGARRDRSGRPVRRIIKYLSAAAAVVAVVCAATYVTVEIKLDEWTSRTTAIEVPPGHYMSMQLEDGTTVWLNSGTRLDYPLVFAGKERRVKLTGEAMFEVAHDKDHPFVVETFAYEVEVLGTKFNVTSESLSGSFSASLLEGSVKVRSRATPNEYIMLRPNETLCLIDGYLYLEEIDDHDGFLWTRGMISLKGLSFAELMKKFEKSFDVEIVVERERMPSNNYNLGKVRISDGIDSALHLLQLGSDFTYTKSEDGSLIYIK